MTPHKHVSTGEFNNNILVKGQQNEIDKQQSAALKIQTCFRGYCARQLLAEEYIKENYEIQSNVPTIREAKIFALGEDHTKNIHRIKNAWVIDHLYKKGKMDRILNESQALSPEILESTEKEQGQVKHVKKEIEIKGWDAQSDPLLNKAAMTIMNLSDLLTLLENGSDAQGKVNKIIFDNLIVELKSNHPHIVFQFDQTTIDDFFSYNPQEFIAALICKAFIEAKKDLIESVERTFAQRQNALNQNIDAENVSTLETKSSLKEKKIFVIAGYAHFVNSDQFQSENTLSLEKNFQSNITKYPYAILIPKKQMDHSATETFIDGYFHNSLHRLEEFVKQNSSNLKKFFPS